MLTHGCLFQFPIGFACVKVKNRLSLPFADANDEMLRWVFVSLLVTERNFTLGGLCTAVWIGAPSNLVPVRSRLSLFCLCDPVLITN